jgi:hypothetical protein
MEEIKKLDEQSSLFYSNNDKIYSSTWKCKFLKHKQALPRVSPLSINCSIWAKAIQYYKTQSAIEAETYLYRHEAQPSRKLISSLPYYSDTHFRIILPVQDIEQERRLFR